MINAPLPVTAFALLLVGLHLVRILLPESWQSAVFFQGALIPGRFWAPEESPGPAGLPGYQGPLAAFVPLIASGLLHSDWMHVILNAAFLIALAKPLLELFRRVWPGQEPGASGLLLGLFLFSQIISGLFYLGLNHPGGGAAVGASGGVSGLLAAILLIREGPRRWLLARGFLVATALFVVANALIALLGPSLLGASIAWEAHLGGYVGGAVAMRLVLLRFGAGAA
jgi:membrane associated rhomboid family serine protease